MRYDQQTACKRLLELRKSRNYSQNEMAQKLSELVIDRALDGDNGKNTVSQLERGARGITLSYAFAYSEIFNVSLDYVLGRSVDWTPEYEEIRELTGWNNSTIREFMRYTCTVTYEEGSQIPPTANNLKAIGALLENEKDCHVLQAISGYLFSEFADIGNSDNESFEVLNTATGRPQRVSYAFLSELYLNAVLDGLKKLKARIGGGNNGDGQRENP